MYVLSTFFAPGCFVGHFTLLRTNKYVVWIM